MAHREVVVVAAVVVLDGLFLSASRNDVVVKLAPLARRKPINSTSPGFLIYNQILCNAKV